MSGGRKIWLFEPSHGFERDRMVCEDMARVWREWARILKETGPKLR